jgi:hypothetical protein
VSAGSDPGRDHEDERDAQWLLARERGEQVSPLDAQRSATYERLIGAIRDLPTIIAPDDMPGRVLAAIDRGDAPESSAPRRATRPWAVAAVAAVAMAAGIVLFMRPDASGPPPGQIATEVRHGSVARRGEGAAIGDTLVVRAQVPPRGELRIYRGDAMVARCPGGPTCRENAGGVSVEMELDVPGRYRPVMFGSGVASPSGRAADDFDAAMRARIDAYTAPPVDVR